MGTFAVRNVDSRSVTWQRDVPGTSARCRESSQDTLETGEYTVSDLSLHLD